MPDVINEGFGATAPAILATATNDVMCRYIQAPADNFVRIRAIELAVLQITGAVALNTVIPLWVLRGAANLGVAAAAGGILGVPVRPTGLVLPGLPDIPQLLGSIELLLATYIASRNGRLIAYPADLENHLDLVARDTQKLAVCIGPLIDVSVSPPVVVPASTFGATLTVLGAQGKLDSRATQLPGNIGVTKSLQRYDIEVSEEVDSRVHPSSK